MSLYLEYPNVGEKIETRSNIAESQRLLQSFQWISCGYEQVLRSLADGVIKSVFAKSKNFIYD